MLRDDERRTRRLKKICKNDKRTRWISSKRALVKMGPFDKSLKLHKKSYEKRRKRKMLRQKQQS